MAIKVANNNSLSAITSLPAAISGGAMTLLETQTASDTATISFTSNIDSTYKEYVFKFYDIHPETNNVDFQFNGRDGSTAYDATKTTTFFRAHHPEDDSSATLIYSTGNDLAQGTGFQNINDNVGNGNDECVSGELHLYDPSNTTFVKHFYSRCNSYDYNDASLDFYMAGYFNVTSAIDGIQFKMSSGNCNGVIKLYGIS